MISRIINFDFTEIHSEIVQGTKFFYRKTFHKHELWALGPLLSEVVLLVSVNYSFMQGYYVLLSIKSKKWNTVSPRSYGRLGSENM